MIVEDLQALAQKIEDIPGFIKDEELRASYAIVHTALSAVMFEDTVSLAETCANWCSETARRTTEMN